MLEPHSGPAPTELRLRRVPPSRKVLLHCEPLRRRAVEEALGVPLSEQMLSSASGGGWTSLHLAPDEWLLVGATPETPLPKLSDPALPTSLVEVSDRFLVIEVDGRGATDVLAVACPLDFDVHAFPAGGATRAPLGKVDVVIWRRDLAAFQLLVGRSFEPYAVQLLHRAAMDWAIPTTSEEPARG